MTPYVYIISEDYGDSITTFPTIKKLLEVIRQSKPCYLPYISARLEDGTEENYNIQKFIELGYIEELEVDLDAAQKYAEDSWIEEKKATDDYLSSIKGTVTGCFGPPPKEQIKQNYINERKYRWI